jgi:hypothetical protein
MIDDDDDFNPFGPDDDTWMPPADDEDFDPFEEMEGGMNG